MVWPERANGNLTAPPDPLSLMLPGKWDLHAPAHFPSPTQTAPQPSVGEKTLLTVVYKDLTLLGKMKNFNPHPTEKPSWFVAFKVHASKTQVPESWKAE